MVFYVVLTPWQEGYLMYFCAVCAAYDDPLGGLHHPEASKGEQVSSGAMVGMVGSVEMVRGDVEAIRERGCTNTITAFRDSHTVQFRAPAI